MKKRATDDRRTQSLKVNIDRRKIRRRQDDKDNIKTYYAVLSVSIATFLTICVVSVIWGM